MRPQKALAAEPRWLRWLRWARFKAKPKPEWGGQGARSHQPRPLHPPGFSRIWEGVKLELLCLAEPSLIHFSHS